MPEGLLESPAENLTARDLSDSDLASIARKLLANYGTAKLSVPGGLLSALEKCFEPTPGTFLTWT